MPKSKIRVQDVFSGRRSILDESAYNDQMRAWSAEVQRLAKREASAFTKGKRRASRTYRSGPKAGKTETKLRSNITHRLWSDTGEVAGIGFQFPRHGIFLEYGVSRGHPVGHLRRSISDWLSSTLDRKEDNLVEIVSQYHADRVIKLLASPKIRNLH